MSPTQIVKTAGGARSGPAPRDPELREQSLTSRSVEGLQSLFALGGKLDPERVARQQLESGLVCLVCDEARVASTLGQIYRGGDDSTHKLSAVG